MQRKSITLSEAQRTGDALGLDLQLYSLRLWRDAMEIELEHGTIDPRTDVTDDSLVLTGKIALAHIIEYPDYYERLIRLEEQAEQYWETHTPPHYVLGVTAVEAGRKRKVARSQFLRRKVRREKWEAKSG